VAEQTHPSTWDEHDLERRLLGTLDIAARAVSVLAPDGYVDVDRPEQRLTSEKVVSETAVLLLAAARVLRPVIKERLDTIARLLIPHAQGDRVRALICMEPSLALDHGLAHACLSRLGYRDAELDRLLGKILSSQHAVGHERLPNRELEQVWARSLCDFVTPADRGGPAILRRSMPCIGIDALSSSRDDVYSFTHALMYATDLGSRVPKLPRARRDILADAEAALARCLDEDDYDLGAEVLWAWPMLHSGWTASAIFGFTVLTAVEDAAGFLPNASVRLDRYRELSGEARSRYALATAYHTAYAMGVLCATALGSGCLPARDVPTSRHERGSAAAILGLIAGADARSHWRRCLDELKPAQQDALAPLLMAMSLRHAAVCRDFPLLKASLEMAVRYRVLVGPSPRQAADLLGRAATLSLSVRLG